MGRERYRSFVPWHLKGGTGRLESTGVSSAAPRTMQVDSTLLLTMPSGAFNVAKSQFPYSESEEVIITDIY